MKRLAISVVLTVVVTSSGSLIAACGNGVCQHSATHGNCQHSQPVYHNTEFPGTCRDCKDEYAYSLWADYCNTKHRGPAYKLHRHKSCLHCGPRLGDSCGAQCPCGQHHGHANASVVAPNNDSVQPYPAAGATNNEEPTEAGAPDELVPPSEPQATPDQIDAEGEAFAPNSPALLPPETRYFGQPRSKNVSTTDGNGIAEFDEETMPDAPVPGALDGFGTEEEIKQSVDEAVEKALESGGEAPTPREFDDRSAKKRSSLFRIFRPRSR